MLNKKTKQKIIEKFRIHKNDTGSSQVQIAILTKEIKELTKHLQEHKQDHSSRRGLLKKVGERKALLKYLFGEDEKAFKKLAEQLKLRIAKKIQEEGEKKEKEESIEKEMVEEEIIEEEISKL